jgi:hypothetical protein
MTMPGQYRRSFLPIGPADGPISEETAAGVLGDQVEITLGGVAIAAGTVTDLRVSKQRLMAVIEDGGRACANCSEIYPEDQAGDKLAPASSYVGATPLSEQVQPWSPVCVDRPRCARRAAEKAAPDRAGSDARPDRLLPGVGPDVPHDPVRQHTEALGRGR